MDLETLRLLVYGRFRRGQSPRVADLAGELATTQEQVAEGLIRLAAARHLALGEDGEITMAHPFTAVPLGFSVMGQDTLWWGGCAWDSFAIPHLLPRAGGRWWWPRPALGAAEPMRGRWIIESLPPEITLLTS